MIFIPSISSGDLRILQNSGKKFTLLDVREQYEWDAGHIEKAIHIPLGTLELNAKKEITNETGYIVVYCARGNRSARAQKIMTKMGYGNVYNLKGGYIKYSKTG